MSNRYRVRAKDGSFSFTIIMGGDALFRDGSWDITDTSNLKALGPLLVPGPWRFAPGKGGAPGALWFKPGNRKPHPGVMMFRDVPGDFVHGDFCSTTSGEGVIFPDNTTKEIPIEWTIDGPGCT
ncbi:hypothetical protein [Viridibacterium curvum]|uniref:Uncharacterized protein n=1 Tax=Viridibacterium curvum TaxID=1101404 RepID=A0ABP9R5M7_9RHOO